MREITYLVAGLRHVEGKHKAAMTQRKDTQTCETQSEVKHKTSLLCSLDFATQNQGCI